MYLRIDRGKSYRVAVASAQLAAISGQKTPATQALATPEYRYLLMHKFHYL